MIAISDGTAGTGFETFVDEGLSVYKNCYTPEGMKILKYARY